jgi:pimeloyl-ACP methyl ester carboxylesterase
MIDSKDTSKDGITVGESVTRRDLVCSTIPAALAGVPLAALAANKSASAADLPTLQISDVSFGGHRLTCYRGGEGPALLLLHGNPGASESWRLQVAPLINAGFEVIAYDLLGTGRSSVSGTVADYAFKNELAGVWRVLDAAGIDRLHAVIDHDRGGVPAWRMAAQNRERVNRLVVLSVGPPGKPF